MLSLLSLLLASGTVLRADTERWTPRAYPNPRRNHTGCNTWENSTLCDPDHILTDQWRAQINENIQRQMLRLTEANVPLAEKAPPECQNRTEGVTIFVLLAKRIWSANNQSITGNDLTNFGDELAVQYGLNELPCKTFLLLIGIEAAKLAYVRTGKDLRLPVDLMQRVFHEYKLFNAKNFMAGLNKIVDEIGEQMADPFKDQAAQTTASSRPNATSSAAVADSSTTSLAEIVAGLMKRNEGEWANGQNGTAAVEGEVRAPGDSARGTIHAGTAQWWMFLCLGTAILISFGSLALLALSQQRQRERRLRQMHQNVLNGHLLRGTDLIVAKLKKEQNGKEKEPPPDVEDVEKGVVGNGDEGETMSPEGTKLDDDRLGLESVGLEQDQNKDQQQKEEPPEAAKKDTDDGEENGSKQIKKREEVEEMEEGGRMKEDEERETNSSSGDASSNNDDDSTMCEEEHQPNRPRVRIGPAELATDVVIAAAAKKESGNAGEEDRKEANSDRRPKAPEGDIPKQSP